MLLLSGIKFRPEYLDFDRGIRVGNLEDNERITRLLKLQLEGYFGEPFVTERWGRGVYWQWIGFLPRSNRTAKPLSSHVSFGCSKFFLTIDREEKLFKCGLQIERGYSKPRSRETHFTLQKDWDWNRLVRSMKTGTLLEKELKRLLREGFSLEVGAWGNNRVNYSSRNFPKMSKLKNFAMGIPGEQWAGLMLYYPMKKEEVLATSGIDLVESMIAVFLEVTTVMNLSMQVELKARKILL